MTTLATRPPARLRGLAATLALVAFVVGVPVLLVTIDAIPDPTAFSASRLAAPDDGSLALEVIIAVCWIAWAIFTGQVVAAIGAHSHGVRTPRLPGLALPQRTADRLVAAAALLFIAAPTVTAVLPQPRAEAAASAVPPSTPDSGTVAPTTTGPGPVLNTAPSPALKDRTERYTVKRGDSLWRIAEERLGDGTRYVELVDLNRAVLGGRPDFLLPGTVLRVPAAPELAASSGQGHEGGTYVVRPGDTLSAIANEVLGDPDAYPAIVEASGDTVQPDGGRLTNPDLIRPGWQLTVPGHASPPPVAGAPVVVPPAAPPPAAPVPQAPRPATAAPDDADTAEEASPGWLLPGLSGAGATLGAGLWLALVQKRRTQLRYRRPGRIVPAPPVELLPAEKTACATASVVLPKIEALHAALNSLAPPPRLERVALYDDRIALTLATPADLPTPWSGSGIAWQVAIEDVAVPGAEVFPPYPLLASVGRADDGALVFLNLEEARTVAVTGPRERTAALARHLAAELAVNPWSLVTRVELLGLGPDLASFNIGRVRTHPASDTGFIDDLVRRLEHITDPAHDPDDFHAAIIATNQRPGHELAHLTAWLHRFPGRTSAVLIDLDGDPAASRVHLELTDDGRLRISDTDLSIAAAGLTESEAKACALLIDLTLDEQSVEIPAPSDPEAVADDAGALVERLIDPRPDGVAGPASVLPLDSAAYVKSAATTTEDVAAVAPVVVPEAREAVHSADPDLDNDLARWESPMLTSTKLTLLGPVGARTTGDAKDTAHRRPFYVELLAYLTLHPKGAPGAELAEAFGLRPDRVRVDMSQLRRWLGNDPRTGDPYLPSAQPGPTPGAPSVYRLRGVLCDLDLFRRLRTRGQARGADGIDDLVAALNLVSGEPFTRLREGHWTWLLDGDRWDHLMTSAIVDVGHIVTTHALATDNPALATWAATVAYTASPYDEVAQLDLVAAEKASGKDADGRLADRVLNRRDDDLPPIDLPSRTAKILRDKNWAPASVRPRRSR